MILVLATGFKMVPIFTYSIKIILIAKSYSVTDCKLFTNQFLSLSSILFTFLTTKGSKYTQYYGLFNYLITDRSIINKEITLLSLATSNNA
jgi:hypothetical protein